MRLKQRLIALPDGIDIVTFVEHDGKPPHIGPTLADSPRKAVTLGQLKDRYLTTHAKPTGLRRAWHRLVSIEQHDRPGILAIVACEREIRLAVSTDRWIFAKK
jgi:hypothetical protein